MPLTSILPGFLLSYFVTIQRPSSIPFTLHLVVASHHMNFNARQRFFYYMASGMAGKSKDRFRVRQKQQGYPHALKPLYATVSCQFLRPRVRATPFCEGARCAIKTQQRNTKHTPFAAWDFALRVPESAGILSDFQGRKKEGLQPVLPVQPMQFSLRLHPREILLAQSLIQQDRNRIRKIQ